MIDWTLFALYAGPVLALLVGAWLDRIFERRPRLISYLAHASAVTIHPPGGQETQVHSHTVVVRNAGKRPACNARLGHNLLPEFSVYPAVNYAIVDLPGGSRELVFPALVPGEQVNVTYLYFPPVVWSNVNSYTKSDEGFAKIINVLPTPQFSPWLTRITWALLIIGGTTVLVGIGQVVALIVRHLRAA